MRALSIEDMEIVSGGLTEGDALALGTGLGSAVWVGVGEYFGVSTAQATLLAGIGAAYGAGITSAAIIGWYVGNAINSNTPIQSWIASAISGLEQDGDGPY